MSDVFQDHYDALVARIAELERIIADAQAAPDAVEAALKEYGNTNGRQELDWMTRDYMQRVLTAANLHNMKDTPCS